VSAAKHTPGPWSVEIPYAGFSAIRGAKGELVFGIAVGGAESRQPPEVCEANARLIAAAPALYAALERALPYLENHMAMTCRDDYAGFGDRLAYDAALAALKQARGEP
jgi:hypothetical protein